MLLMGIILGYRTTIPKKLKMALKVEQDFFFGQVSFCFWPILFLFTSPTPKLLMVGFQVFAKCKIPICNLSHLFSILQWEHSDNKQHISFVPIGLNLDLNLNLPLAMLERSSKVHRRPMKWWCVVCFSKSLVVLLTNPIELYHLHLNYFPLVLLK